MTAVPLEWKQLLTDVLEEAKVIPLWGNPPDFPWEALAEGLAKEWKLPGLAIQCTNTAWAKKEDVLHGLGTKPVIIPIEAPPLEDVAYLAISSEDMLLLSHAVLQPLSSRETLDASLARGFYQFLLLQAIHTFTENAAYPNLHVKIAAEQSLPNTTLFACDIALTWQTGRVYAKLLLSQGFLAAFRHAFPVESSAFLESPATKKLSVSLRLIGGHTSIPLNQWQQASVGDFVILDKCTLSPERKGGKARFFLHETPLFEVAIRKGKISLLDYAFYQEESNTMNDNADENGEKHDHQNEIPSDEDLDETLETEEDEDFTGEDAALDAAFDNEDSLEESPEILHTPSGTEDMKYVIAHSEIPLNLVVEVARMRMNLDKLLQLQPGNVLELGTQTTSAVRLCTGGKCVATGELVAIGETIGVKITKIGA